MLTRGLVAGSLLALAATGCAVLVPAVPFVAKPAERISIINLKTVESTVDKSLQDTVAISFVPPKVMTIDAIEFRVNGRQVTQGDYDIVLETDKLKVGEHVVNLYARGDGNVVQGTTKLIIIESGKEPVTEEEAAAAALSGGTGNISSQPSSQTSGQRASTSRSKLPSLAGDAAVAKAKVAIKIRLPDE
jgi:hypothetical protein